nr:MAG TPA: hypothetical protein [Caudoviricetes sp.]
MKMKVQVKKFENSGWYFYILENVTKLTPAVVAGVNSYNIFKENYIQEKAVRIILKFQKSYYSLIKESQKTGEVSKRFTFTNFRASILENCSKKDWSVSVLILDELIHLVKERKKIWKEVSKAQEEEDI